MHQNLGIINQMSAVENVALTSGFNVRPGFPIRLRTQAEREQALFDRFGVDVDLWTPLGKCRPIDRTIVAIVRALDGMARTGRAGARRADVSVAARRGGAPLRHRPRATRRGVTTIYVSHRLDEVFRLVDRVSVLRDGVLQGTRASASSTERELVRMIVGSVPARYDAGHEPTADGRTGATDSTARLDRARPAVGNDQDVDLTSTPVRSSASPA